jgi:glutathione S-transferase
MAGLVPAIHVFKNVHQPKTPMGRKPMIKIWGRKTSSNVQKAMWAVGELGLAHERIDVGGAFGQTKDPFYLAMNPNSLVPTLEEEDGFTLWESNSVVRYLAGKHGGLEPSDPKIRARASQWMDWQLSVMGPAITPVFWGMIRTPPEKRDPKAIDSGKAKTNDAAKILDGQLAKTRFLAGDAFSYGDIPAGVMVRRYVELMPERPAMPNLDRWYAELAARPAFQEHCGGIPLT